MTSYQNGWTLYLSAGVPTLDVTQTPIAVNPFGPAGAAPSFQTVTARSLIDTARIQHWAFSALTLGDGAALLFFNQRQREHLAKGGAEIEGLIGTAVEYKVPTTPATTQFFVGFRNGVPYTLNPGQDGWAVHVDLDGVPFVDPNELQIAADPLVQNGGVQGFPLPGEMVRLINVMLLYGPLNPAPGGGYIPVNITNERARQSALPGRNPTAFVAGNRLIPMLVTKPGVGINSGDRWFGVTAIQFSYVSVDTIRSLDDPITLPVVLCGALIQDLVVLFANQAKDVTISEKQNFALMARDAGASASKMALDLLNSPMTKSVRFNG